MGIFKVWILAQATHYFHSVSGTEADERVHIARDGKFSLVLRKTLVTSPFSICGYSFAGRKASK